MKNKICGVNLQTVRTGVHYIYNVLLATFTTQFWSYN
jgi:hypothetical protein